MADLLDALGQPHVQLLLRLVLGGLLVFAGATKLPDRVAFRNAIAEYELLPQRIEAPIAALLPIVEITLGVFLLLGLGTAVAAGLAIPLFAGFAAAIGTNLVRGRHFDCHCFGSVQSEQIGAPAFLRAAALALAALVVALGASGFGALDGVLFGSNGLPSTAEVIPIVFIAFVILDVLILLPEVLSFQTTLSRARAGWITGVASHANGRHA